MYNTLKTYHFGKLPQSLKDKAEKMIDDICPLGILDEGTIDAVEVWGRDDILLLMRAMYNEARKTEFFTPEMMWKIFQAGKEAIEELNGKETATEYVGKLILKKLKI